MVCCFVVGTEFKWSFEVAGDNGMTISKLKEIIYEMIKTDYKENFGAHKLALWKVDIPGDTANIKLKPLENRSHDIKNEINIIKEIGGEELQHPFSDLGDIFTSSSKNIRLIVQPPLFASIVSPNIPYVRASDRVKIEIGNKVMRTFSRIDPLSIDELIDALALIWHKSFEIVSPDQQNDLYVELKKEPSFFKVNFPRGLTKNNSNTVDLCLPSYSKSGMNYHNLFYNDPQFKKTVSLVQTKIEKNPGHIIVLAGVSGGGKTSTSFGIAMKHWSIYIDFSPRDGNYPSSQLNSELEIIRGIRPQFERVDQQNEVFHLLDIAVVSRGLLLIKLLTEGKISTPKEWLFVQLQMSDREIRQKLGVEKYYRTSITKSTLIEQINKVLGISSLVLIFDEAQVLCESVYGKYEGSSIPGKKWNLLQGYVTRLVQHPVTCLLAGTYMHMTSGVSLVTSIGKEPNRKAHIVLKLPFLLPDDVLRNLDTILDMTGVTPNTRDLLGHVLQGRPRNCASFVRLLILKERSIGTKNQVLQELIPLWHNNTCSDVAKYFETTCEYLGADHINPEKAIMDVLRLRVFYNHNYMEAIKLLQHSIIPCESPECIVLDSKVKVSEIIEINTSLESYLVDSIDLYLRKSGKQMIDVFVDNIVTLNNISSIGNEFDAVFIAAIINKRGLNVREELNKWKNGQQFDLPSWITPTMEFVTQFNISGNVPLVKYVNDSNYSSYAIQPDIHSGSDAVMYLVDNKKNVLLLSASCTVSSCPIDKKKVIKQSIKTCLNHQYMECQEKKKTRHLQIGLDSTLPTLSNDATANKEDNLEGEKNEEYDQDLNYGELDYDLNYTKNIKDYRISNTYKYAEYHEQIKNSTKNRNHIYVTVELPHRAGNRSGKRPELFRLNQYGDLVIIVDDRNMEHVFGPAINRLLERISYKDQVDLMDQTE